jgi:G3E family GTPase
MRLLHRPWRLGQSAAHLKKFDHIIIETTGLADPAPVAFTFFINPEIADHYRIDSILCLAGAKHIGPHLEEEKPVGVVNEAASKVAFADRILLNKIDLVSDTELLGVMDQVRSINGVAEVIKTTNSSRGPRQGSWRVLVLDRENFGGGSGFPGGRGGTRGGDRRARRRRG